MRRKASVLAAAALAAGLAGMARGGDTDGSPRPRADQLPLEGTVTNPDWSEKPTAEEMSNYYPPVAQIIGLAGHALITCEITTSGATVNCKVLNETPVGMGFGDAAISLSKYFRMKPMQLDGSPVGGGKVTIPIGFAFPPSQPPADDTSSATPPPTARALDLARRLAALEVGDQPTQAYAEQFRAYLMQRFSNLSLSEQELAAIDDYMAAYAASGALRTQLQADRLAHLFSEQELAQIDAFMESPAGKAWVQRQNADAAETLANNQRVGAAISEDARRRFCASVQCMPAQTTAAPSAK